MKPTSPTFKLMTATLSPGDAIGNYMLTLRRVLAGWGARVELYADSILPGYGAPASPFDFYRPAGDAVLWYHYSIYSGNMARAIESRDFKLMDYHGVTPPWLFTGYDPHMAEYCSRAIDLLPTFRDAFDLCVVHSEYARGELLAAGYPESKIVRLPLCVDLSRFAGSSDPELVAWLSSLTYLLFVGRIVPQKDILALLEIVRRVHEARPQVILILVGSRQWGPGYQREIDEFMRAHCQSSYVFFLDQINDLTVLSALYQHARLLTVMSEWESFCVPLVEAMHLGVPAVVHRIPALVEVAGEGGVVIDKRDPQQAAQTVLDILDDSSYAARLSQAARQRAAGFTDGTLARSVLDMLAQFLIG